MTLHLIGGISEDERTLLNQWINNSERNAQLFNRITDAATLAGALLELQGTDTETALLNAKQKIAEEKYKQIRPATWHWTRIAAAASIILCLSVGGYFLLHQKTSPQIAQTQTHDIAPGNNQATLTLANGQKIILTKGLNGKLAQQGNMSIRVNSGNEIAYTASATKGEPIQYNTLSTKNGEQSPYPLILSDGTKVWLNAASSVTYPTAFVGKERVVNITGEAYFEVVHHAAQPFKVNVNGQTIEDIGTRFNINAYHDEPNSKTTLLEGSAKVSFGTNSELLRPGQQAVLHAGGLSVNEADTEETMAWKEGMFRFNSATLDNIMKQVSRWYDVDIVYQDEALRSKHFSARTTRFGRVSQLLHNLELIGEVKFRVEGKKIIVLNR